MPTTTSSKEKLLRIVVQNKNILLIILVIWMFSFAYYRNNVPFNTLDPSRVRTEMKVEVEVEADV